MTTPRTYSLPSLAMILIGSFMWSFAAPPLLAQAEEPSPQMIAFMKSMTPGEPHAYLKTLEGTWKASFWFYSSPDAEPTAGSGTIERKMVMGGRVLEETIDAALAGLPYKATGHVGHDNVSGRYWATSFDSLSTGLTVLWGEIDTATGKATFKGQSPDLAVGDSVPMRLEFYNEDGKQISESYFTRPGGEVLIAKTVYERQ